MIINAGLEGVSAEGPNFASIADLRSWVASRFGTTPSGPILMTSNGLQVKEGNLNEHEIYFFDRDMLAKQELPASLPYPRPPGLPTHISSLARDSDAGRLSAWAKDCLESTRALESNAQVIRNSLRIRISSVNVALLNMGSHATALRKSYSSVQQGWDSVSNLIAFLEKLQTDRLLGQGSLAEHLNLREKYSEPDMSNLNSAIRDIEQDSFRLQMSVDDWQNEAESIWREIEANVNEVVVLTTKIEEDIARTKFRRLSEDVVPGLRESFDEVLMLRLQLENRYENDPNQALGFLKGLSAIQSRIYINSNAVRGHLLEEELINGINKDMEAYIMKLLKLTSREDLQSLLGQLKQEKALAPVVALLTESLSGESKRNSTMLVDNDNSRELKQLRLKLRDTQSRNHNLEDLIHRQKLRLNTAPSSHISSPTERESTLSQRVYEKSVEVTNLQDSLDQLRINKLQSAERVVSLEAKVKSQDEEIDELVATRSDALNSKSAMEEKLEDATAQLSKYEKEVAHLHEVQNELVAKFERELADCKGRLNFVENEKSDLQRNLDIYTTKFNSTQRRMSATEKEYVNFKINAEKVGEDLRIAKSENASLQEELEHARQSHATELASIEDASSNTIGLLRATLVSQQNAWGEEKASYQNTFENDRDLKILCESRTLKARELTQRLYTYHLRCHQLLENIGLTLVKQNGSDSIIERRNSEQDFTFHATDLPLIHWMEAKDSEEERDKYAQYLEQSTIDLDVFQDAVVQKFKSLTSTSKRYLKEAKVYRERAHKLQSDAKRKIAYRGFKEGDLALFLPTKNSQQGSRPWAAFNELAPHYFLREDTTQKLAQKEFLIARIQKIETHLVSATAPLADASLENNPFGLSGGLKWYLLDAVEEKSRRSLSRTTTEAIATDASKVEVHVNLE